MLSDDAKPASAPLQTLSYRSSLRGIEAACGAQRFHTSAQAHAHASFGSVGLEASGELDELSFNDWLEKVFTDHNARLYRWAAPAG